jgi:WD40 repeat protein
MASVKHPIRILAAGLFLFLILASPGAAQNARSESLPVGAKARLGRGTIATVQYSSDGTLLAVGGSVGIWLYDARTLEVRSLLTDYTDDSVSNVAFSPDGRTLASVNGDNSIHLWNTASGQLLNTLAEHAGGVVDMAFSSDNKTLVSGNVDGSLHLWNADTGILLRTLESRMESISSVAFGSGGLIVAGGSGDDTLHLWDAATGQLRHSLEGHADGVITMAFSPTAGS